MTAGVGAVEAAGRADDTPLVSSAISHRNHQAWTGRPGGKASYFRPLAFEVNRWRCRIVREPKAFPGKIAAGTRGKIDAFSEKSRRRLREIAANADPALVSMFVATYADGGPQDGCAAKRHLDAFLKRIRRKLPKVGYLWVLEFQGSGNGFAPHFHIFLTAPHSPELGRWLGEAWHEIAGNDCEKHRKVALHPRSFIGWDMGTGTYVAKYLDKARQKYVPPSYVNVGRFWGATRGLVPDPVTIDARDMTRCLAGVSEDAAVQAARWLGKWHEKLTHGRSRARTTGNSYTLATGAPVLKQILRYFGRLPALPPKPPAPPQPEPVAPRSWALPAASYSDDDPPSPF